ncbi:MAG: type IV toxin-antitoxin system AbiEi family antitoxin domain-containing protein [Thermoplasmatales archaeon]|nr:type IV toxin-antitoxin system AbiEi family antitoxin domain-containing protein [Thermoplasmatales archaeon]MCW6170320.1 type IV toxin-antitoxin system AbiEi family antitoxin domain-containing protein [Thermoplasmatales archaeon]
MKYEKSFIDFFSKHNLFSMSDARRFLSRLGASESYIRLMLHNMVHSGKVIKIGKGIYTLQENEAVVGFKFRPFYYGLEYALTIRKIWTQQSVPVIITRTKANPGTRELMGIKVIVHRIGPERFFGFDYMNYDGIFVPVSDPEKTLLDFTYYGIKLDPETMTELRNRIDESKLKDYSKRMFGKNRNIELIRQ